MVFSKLIAIYLFLGGTAAGAFALTALFDVAKAVKDHRRGEYGRAFLAPQSVISEPTYKRIRRFVYGTALIVVLTGELCLVADLGRPETFFFLFLYPTSSLVSIGAFALTLLTVFLVISLADTIFVLPKWARVVSFAAKAIGLPVAVIVMVYTGLLLQSVISVEIWQSAWLPVLFAASALSCGCAVVMLAACTCEDVRVTRIMARLLAWIDIAFILIEIVSIVALLAFGKGSASMAVMRRPVDHVLGRFRRLWTCDSPCCGSSFPGVQAGDSYSGCGGNCHIGAGRRALPSNRHRRMRRGTFTIAGRHGMQGKGNTRPQRVRSRAMPRKRRGAQCRFKTLREVATTKGSAESR